MLNPGRVWYKEQRIRLYTDVQLDTEPRGERPQRPHICLWRRPCVLSWAVRSTLGYRPPAAAPGSAPGFREAPVFEGSPQPEVDQAPQYGPGHVCPGAALGPALQPMVPPPISPPSLLHNTSLYCLVENPQWKITQNTSIHVKQPCQGQLVVPYSTKTPWKPYKIFCFKLCYCITS